MVWSMASIMLTPTVIMGMMSTEMIATLMMHMGMAGARAGMISGAFAWFGFVLTTIAVNNAYTFRSWKITAIDAMHWLVVFIIIGAVVGGLSR